MAITRKVRARLICDLESKVSEQATLITKLTTQLDKVTKESIDIAKWRDCFREQAREAEGKLTTAKYTIDRCIPDAERLGFYTMVVALKSISKDLVINENIRK